MDLRDPEDWELINTSPFAYVFPIAKALRSYKNAAIPAVVEAWFDRQDPVERCAVYDVLWTKEATRAARTHALKIAPRLRGRFVEQDLKKLLVYCEQKLH